MPKGSDPHVPQGKRPPVSTSRRSSSSHDDEADAAAGTRHESSPTLTWAKWIESLGTPSVSEDAPEPRADLAGLAERLREATERARQVRSAREASISGAVREVPATAAAPAAREAATKPKPRPRTSGKPAKAAPRARKQVPAPPREIEPKPAPSPSPVRSRRSERASGSVPPAAPAKELVAAPAPIARAQAPALARRDLETQAPTAPPAPASRSHPPAERLAVHDDPLPHGYGDDRIVLMSKDPYWLHAYWELTGASLKRAWELLGHTTAALALRVHHFAAAHTGDESGSFDVEVSEQARNWYIHGGHPGGAFEVEVGLKSADGRFVGLARSARIVCPTDRPSDLLDEEWLSLAGEFEEIYALSGGYRTLTSGGSLELRELLARRMEEMMGSGAVSSFGISSLGVSSFGAPAIGASGAYPAAPRHRKFWFVLGTELIVYGATEPDAKVTCQGRPVTLRPDGTFTLRFALPDGTQTIPCTATSADRVDTITITPRVEKNTSQEERRHDGDRHP